jgi:LysR family transcriptional regulator, nitrogen assimilation regulatory protein
MKIRQLQYFLRVVEMQNITRAAESLHVAQPALSQQINLLEDELGVKLLARGSKGVLATTEGQLLYRHAQTILRQVESTKSLLNKATSQLSSSVSIGLASSTARLICLPLLMAAKEACPSVVIEIVDTPSADLTKLVMQGRVDFAVSPDQQIIKGLVRMPLFTEELYLITHESTKFKRTRVSVEEMSDLSFILPSPPNQLRTLFDQLFHAERRTYNLFAEASTTAILVPMVSAGLAATVLPFSAFKPELQSNQIRSHRIVNSPKREMMLCVSEASVTSHAVEKVIELMREVIKDLVASNQWKGCELNY